MRSYIGNGQKVSWEGSKTSSGAVNEYSYRRDGLLKAVGGQEDAPQYVWSWQQADAYGVSTKIY
jgi:hypothetical protein